MTFRGETAKNYVTGVVRKQGEELQQQLRRAGSPNAWSDDDIQTRFRYNQAFLSVNAMVPSVFMLMLCLIPAIMSAIAVVREKETGSIANFRSTPITKFEFLLGKQLPYVGVAMVNFVFLFLMAIFVFGVPIKGPFLTLLIGTVIYVVSTTGFGQLISSFTRTQVAAVFATAILSIVPAVNFSGTVRAGFLVVWRSQSSRPDVPVGLVPAGHRRRLRQGARNGGPLAKHRRDRGHRAGLSHPVAPAPSQAGGMTCRRPAPNVSEIGRRQER